MTWRYDRPHTAADRAKTEASIALAKARLADDIKRLGFTPPSYLDGKPKG